MPKHLSYRFLIRLRDLGIFAFVLPSLVLIAFVVAYGRSFPIWETWYFIPVWHDFNTHGSWFPALFVNRWGHISALPNFINLMLDHLSGYDQRLDIFVSTAIAIAALYLLLKYYLPREAMLSRIFLGVTFLSVRVSEIWLDGWNTTMTISLLLSIGAGACVLATRSWKGLLACGLLAFLGINSGGYCLAVLPAVLLVLIVQTWQGQRAPLRQGIAQTLTWILWVAILLGYWTHLIHGQDGGPSAALHTLLRPGFLPLFARMQAFILDSGHHGFLVAAMVPIVLLIGMAAGVWRRPIVQRNLPAFLYMVAYTAVLTILIETSRSAPGLSPLHLRYVPFLCLLPVALLALAECLVAPNVEAAANHGQAPVWTPGRYIVGIALCLFIIGGVRNELHYFRRDSLPNQPQLAALDRAWRQSPWSLTPGMFLYRAATDPTLVAQGLATMRELRIGPFARIAPAPPHLAREKEKQTADIHFGIDNATRNPDGNWVVLGWAFDTRRGLLMSDVYGQLGSCNETALRGLPRPDVSAFFKTSHATNSGWMLTFPAKCAISPHPAIKVYFAEKNGLWNSGEKQP